MAQVTLSTRRAHTQDRLLDAATALFAEKGVLAASIEEICERAGFTRGAFYSNFESRDELLVAVLERKGEQILQAATDATDSVPAERIEPRSVDEVIRAAMLVFQAAHPIDTQWLLARSEIRLYALRNPAVRDAVRAVEDSLNALLIVAIHSVITRQRAELAISPEQLVTLLNSYYEVLAIQALLAGRDPLNDQSAEQVSRLIRVLIDFKGPGSEPPPTDSADG